MPEAENTTNELQNEDSRAEPKPTYTPLTEEQIRAAQVGELVPLAVPNPDRRLRSRVASTLRTRGSASPVRPRRSCFVTRTRRLDLSPRPCCQTENRHAARCR